jgi:xanthine dehydrogenase YagR molybdenum-binding subunit
LDPIADLADRSKDQDGQDAFGRASLSGPPIAKGRIAGLDTSKAEAAPRVILVMTYRNAPRMQPMPLFLTGEKAGDGDNLPIMQDDRIHWNGQPVAVVLAETQEQADHAKSLIAASYAAERATTSFDEAKAKGTEPGSFMGQPLKLEIGAAESALAAAPTKIDAVYRTPRHNHNAIEPHAATLV